MHGSLDLRRRLRTSLNLQDKLDDVLALIGAIERFHDFSTFSRDRAVEAAAEGRPAFLTWSRYHNAAAVGLCDTANGEGLPAAIAAHCDDTYPAPAKHRTYLLGTLIPLNKPAVAQLEDAFEALANDYEREVRAAAKARRAA